MQSLKSIVFYDGLCLVCSTEINHYKKLNKLEQLAFQDITEPNFDPTSHGLDPRRVHKVMHVKDAQGQIHTGVDAFRIIWQNIPQYHFLNKWSQYRPVNFALHVGYHVFALIRPYLPKRKLDCSASPYCEVKK